MTIRQISLLALLFSACGLGFALYTQYFWDLFPCEMCIKQRYGHGLVIVIALFAIIINKKWAVWLVSGALLFAASIAAYHVGIEMGIFNMGCTGQPGTMSTEDLLNRPIVRCDVPAWELFGVSMAGWNGIGTGLMGIFVAVIGFKNLR